ncbi:hypothetical protein R6242_20085 [Iodobacter sp. CM08]|uniref:hypothetical protein n=1 Tax=Iodobacter sp. CM08 TaxID=3085902 RepID=UPI0029811901|nr:hypothetical protein [Iodobacter sp. CM08]MDW5418874.1 hypothetical protein [Iodobacter sp. CM08]
MISQCVEIRPDGLLQIASNVAGACDYVITSGGIWDWSIQDATPVLGSVVLLWAIAFTFRVVIKALNSGDVKNETF